MCVGDEVNITCGNNFSLFTLTPLWIINGQYYCACNIRNTSNSMFVAPLVDSGADTVLTVYSVSKLMNQTTFQCELTPLISSYTAMLTVMGKFHQLASTCCALVV